MQEDKPGDRVVFVSTTDPHTELQPNATGTIEHVDDLGTVHILWDNGARLGLVPGEDEWRPLHPRWDSLDLVQTCPRCGRELAPGCCDTTDIHSAEAQR